MKAPYEELIQNAIKAPSGHNTQPWKFRVEENAIIIYPDYERTLPVVVADFMLLLALYFKKDLAVKSKNI